MHAKQFLHIILSPVMHLKRLNTLTLLVVGALTDRKLSVTQLGRSIINKAQEKNNIKRSDRFLSNPRAHQERFHVYKAFCRCLIGNKPQPWIIVDWSHVPNTTHQLLSAALVLKGRALSIYEEVDPQKLLNNHKIHTTFLNRLKSVLPDARCPIIISDAGFHGAWFEAVRALGWSYVGRVRGNISYLLKGNTQWMSYALSVSNATAEGRKIGKIKCDNNLLIFNSTSKKTPCLSE